MLHKKYYYYFIILAINKNMLLNFIIITLRRKNNSLEVLKSAEECEDMGVTRIVFTLPKHYHNPQCGRLPIVGLLRQLFSCKISVLGGLSLKATIGTWAAVQGSIVFAPGRLTSDRERKWTRSSASRLVVVPDNGNRFCPPSSDEQIRISNLRISWVYSCTRRLIELEKSFLSSKTKTSFKVERQCHSWKWVLLIGSRTKNWYNAS